MRFMEIIEVTDKSIITNETPAAEEIIDRSNNAIHTPL